jgi:membrane protein required for colicin V production
MNLLDYILLAIAGYCLVRGVFRGLIKELTSIIGVMGGFYAAYSYYRHAAHYLSRWVTNPVYLNILSFFILFAAVFLVVSFVGVVLKYLMNITFLGWTDRICGAFFGVAKALLMAVVLVLVLTTFLPANATSLKNSWVAQHTMQFSAYLVKLTPNEMKQSFDAKMKALNRSWHSR